MTKAVARTFSDFEDLSDVELAVVEHCVAGTVARLGAGVPETDGSKVRVRADLVRYLALGGCDAKPVHEKGVQIEGAWISGVIDLELCRDVRQLYLVECRIEAIDAMDAEIDWVMLSGSRCGPLNFQGAKVRGDMFLRGGFTAKGEVCLSGAEIGGQLDCEDGTFEVKSGDALLAETVSIGGDVFLRDGFSAIGAVNFSGARISGEIFATGGRFEAKGAGHALIAHGARIGGSVALDRNEKGQFHATGPVRMSRAEIGGQLTCRGGRFENPDGVALNLQGSTIGAGVLMRDGFEADGMVVLRHGTVRGNLDCTGGDFTAPKEMRDELEDEWGACALNAHGVEVVGDVVLDAMQATGPVVLSGSQVRGLVSVKSPALGVPEGYTDEDPCEVLQLQRAEVAGGVFFNGDLRGDGVISLRGCQAAFLHDDKVVWPDGKLRLDGLAYKRLYPATAPVADRLSWVRQNAPDGDGFEPQPYSQLATVLGEEGNRRDRGTVLMEMERRLRTHQRDHMAELRLREVAEMPRPGRWLGLCYWRAVIGVFRAWDWGLERVVGYGHRPERALLWSLGFLLVTAIWARIVWELGAFAPMQAPVLVSEAWQGVAALAGNPAAVWSEMVGRDYETFASAIWAADVFVPLIDFGQEAPGGRRRLGAVGG